MTRRCFLVSIATLCALLPLVSCTPEPRATPAYDCFASVTTDASSYEVGDSVTLSWDCAPASGDWIALMPAGSPCSNYVYYPWTYTGGAVTSSHVFPGTIGVGTWVARLYTGNTCTLSAESATFTVAPGDPTVAVDASSYGATDDIEVTWTELPGNFYDYVTIERITPSNIVDYWYSRAVVGGTHSFPTTEVGSGTFIARAYDSTHQLLAESDSFTVTGVTFSVATDHASYVFGETVTLSWTLNAGSLDDLLVMPASSLASETANYLQYRYTYGAPTGTVALTNPLPLGTYVVRAYEDSTSFLLAESAPFEVTGPGGPTVDAPELVAPSTAFPVSWTGLAGVSTIEYVQISPWGSTSYLQYSYTAAMRSGTHTFSGLSSGRYEAQAYDSNGATNYLVATDEFVVGEAACTSGGLPVPDGVSCGSGVECFSGLCVPTSGACGNGVRSHAGMSREGCDDGYTSDGDACDATCHPTPLVVASRADLADVPTPQVPSVAEDGTGRLLFVWLAERVASGEPTRDLVARRFTSAGVAVDAEPFTIESDVGATQPVHPAVAGLASGWAVVWRSTAIEGGVAGASQGGIALAIVDRDAGVRSVRANVTTALEQLDPVVAAIDTGVVVVWTDRSGDGVTGDLRMRRFDGTGRAMGGEQGVAAITVGDQSGAFVVGRGSASAPDSRWAVAWTTRDADVSALPELRLRRFDGGAAVDVADLEVSGDWGATPSLAATPDGLYVAWTMRSVDSRGDVAVRFVDDGDATITGAPSATYAPGDVGSARYADDQPAIAPFPADGSEGYVLVHRTASAPAGGRLVASAGVVMPTEMEDLGGELLSREGAFSLVPTERGLWAVWSDPTRTAASAALVAYLAPWD